MEPHNRSLGRRFCQTDLRGSGTVRCQRRCQRVFVLLTHVRLASAVALVAKASATASGERTCRHQELGVSRENSRDLVDMYHGSFLQTHFRSGTTSVVVAQSDPARPFAHATGSPRAASPPAEALGRPGIDNGAGTMRSAFHPNSDTVANDVRVPLTAADVAGKHGVSLNSAETTVALQFMKQLASENKQLTKENVRLRHGVVPQGGGVNFTENTVARSSSDAFLYLGIVAFGLPVALCVGICAWPLVAELAAAVGLYSPQVDRGFDNLDICSCCCQCLWSFLGLMSWRIVLFSFLLFDFVVGSICLSWHYGLIQPLLPMLGSYVFVFLVVAMIAVAVVLELYHIVGKEFGKSIEHLTEHMSIMTERCDRMVDEMEKVTGIDIDMDGSLGDETGTAPPRAARKDRVKLKTELLKKASMERH